MPPSTCILQFFSGHSRIHKITSNKRDWEWGQTITQFFWINFIPVKPSSEKHWRSFCAYSFHRNTNHRNAEGMLSMCPTYFCDATISPLSLRCFFRLLISIKAWPKLYHEASVQKSRSRIKFEEFCCYFRYFSITANYTKEWEKWWKNPQRVSSIAKKEDSIRWWSSHHPSMPIAEH